MLNGDEMRKILFACIFSALAGCANEAQLVQQRAIEHAKAYVAENKPRAQRGELSWSSYYRGGYEFFSRAGAPGDMLARINEAIRDSEEYEQGKISLSEFEYRKRALEAKDRTARQGYAEQEEQQRAIRAQQVATQIAAAAQIMQASAPRPLAPPVQVASAPSNVIMGFLQAQSTNGMLRYCKYTNGVVNTINLVELCPLNTQ